MEEKKGKIPVLSVSMDNVIIHGENTHSLASFLKKYALRHGKLGLFRRVFILNLRRNNQQISQRRLKFELVRLLRGIKNTELNEKFAQKIASNLKPKARKIIDEFQSQGGKIVLTTSAPGEYALLVAENIGANHCICTPTLDEFRKKYPTDPIDYEECAGTEKVHSLTAWIEEIGGTLHTVISGEYDDLPLLLLPEIENRYLSSPSKLLRRTLRRENILFEII